VAENLRQADRRRKIAQIGHPRLTSSDFHTFHRFTARYTMPQQHSTTTMNVNKMSVTLLKQELNLRGIPTDGLKPALIERLEMTMSKNSNDAFHSCTEQIKETAAGITSAEENVAALEKERAKLEAALANNQHKLDAARQRIPVLRGEHSEAQRELKALEPRLFFEPKLPACVLLSIVGQVRKKAGQRAACVKREWQSSVETANCKGLRMYDVKSLLLPVTAGAATTAVRTEAGELFTFGGGEFGRLGHGGTEHELVPRLVVALAGKKVVGVAAGSGQWYGPRQETSLPLGRETVGSWATEGHDMCPGWSTRWQGRRWSVPPPEVLTPRYGLMLGSFSPLGGEVAGSWATEGLSWV